jgi:hypothetical protein
MINLTIKGVLVLARLGVMPSSLILGKVDSLSLIEDVLLVKMSVIIVFEVCVRLFEGTILAQVEPLLLKIRSTVTAEVCSYNVSTEMCSYFI